MARIYVSPSNIDREKIYISRENTKYLTRVLRLGKGALVSVFDGEGNEYLVVLKQITRSSIESEVIEKKKQENESALNLLLAFSILKGDKNDLVIQKLSELGIKGLAPLITEYSQLKLERRKAILRCQRWQKIAIEAARQSGRARIPEVYEISDFKNFLAKVSRYSLKILFWEKETDSYLKNFLKRRLNLENIVLIIGPEGGFSDSEIKLARNTGFSCCSLGPRALRSETAAITAVSIVQYELGDLSKLS